MRFRVSFLPLLGLSVIGAVVAAMPGQAQGLNSGGVAGSGFAPPVHGVAPRSTAPEQAPPGLPGSQPRNTAAPAQIPLDVPPTEALFDAINRGDIAAARDALNRGADLNGRSVLGMTPIELSIDLSRNDITFLLMSMRSEAAVSGPPQAVPSTKSPAPKKGQALAGNSKKRKAPETASVAAPTAPAATPVNVPSTPVPQAGFLGFGASATP